MQQDKQITKYEPVISTLVPRQPYQPSADFAELEEPPNLLAYLQTIRKRRWTIQAIFLIVFLLVLVGTLKQTPIYRATALLEIQKEHPEVASLNELFELEGVSDTYLETQYSVLGSESLTRRVIEQLDLERLAEFAPPKPWWSLRSDPEPKAAATVEATLPQDTKRRRGVLNHFQERLTIEPVKRSRIVSVSFESKDPDLAARVVNTLAANYIEQSLEARWDATQKATEWLSQQLTGLKARLEKSEDEMQRYARENRLVYLESEKGNSENIADERLRQLQETLTRAQATFYEKEALYTLVQKGDFSSLPGIAESKLIQDLLIRLAELRRERAQLATTFNADYPKVKQLQSQIDEIEGFLTKERQSAAQRVTNEYFAAKQNLESLEKAFAAQQEQAGKLAEKAVQYGILKREVETNRQLYEGLLQRLKEAGVSAGLKASNIRIVDPAEPPEKPIKPRIFLNLILGIAGGLTLGLVVAFLQEHLDNTIKSSEDVERLVRLPTLASIPAAESFNGHRNGAHSLPGRMKLLVGGNGDEKASTPSLPRWFNIGAEEMKQSILSEAFHILRTSVLLSSAERPPRTLIVSSAEPGEGKTTVCANLAISLSQLGQSVLIIDGDMRRPAVHRVFQLGSEPGLVNYLTGQADWRDVVRSTNIPGLAAIVTGQVPPNPVELLACGRMRALVAEAAREFSFVLLDSPPILNVADSRVLSTLVEGVILVVRAGETPRDLVLRAQTHVRGVGATVFGVVLNNLDVEDDVYAYRNYSDINDGIDQPRNFRKDSAPL